MTVLVFTSQDVCAFSLVSPPAITGILFSPNSRSGPKLAKCVRYIDKSKDVGARTITATVEAANATHVLRRESSRFSASLHSVSDPNLASAMNAAEPPSSS